MRVLVSGAAGFSGQRMMEFLSTCENVTPFGLIRQSMPKDVRLPGTFLTGDLLNPDSLSIAISQAMPDAIIHLAGLTRGTADALQTTNVTGTRNLLDACLRVTPECRIVIASSSAVYGYAGEAPIPETAPLNPVGDYGRSKVAQEALSLSYHNDGAAITIARPFNLAGPRQPDSFICGKIVRQVAEIQARKRRAIDLQEIASARDIIDVRDIVRGYWALLSCPDFTKDCSGATFNLGSGNAYRISFIISLIEGITGECYEIRLPEKSPPIMVPSQQSDNSRIAALTGWKPEIPLKETLRDMLDACNEKCW